MAKNFIKAIFMVTILLLSSPSKLMSQITVPSQTTINSSPPPPINYVCPYSCQPPPIPTAKCPPPPSPPLPTVPVPPSFYYPPPSGGEVPNIPPFGYANAPPPPNPILPYFPWYYKYPPPPEFSVAIRLKGEKLINIPCFMLLLFFFSLL
ncbi:hypothetical protein P3X46_016184 [Hevea brasiliensis]|uniref:Extensin domain-containing protein n=1 Tax=Hevea brasiliensis TaxID=3981 RepID=A0ABQ9LYG5_HEVBR|nr:hypothetical protein P3X46_016184 [Hevea brasiliensis]